MSETTPAVEPQGTPAAPAPESKPAEPAAPPAPPAAPAQETDWKAEARKWEARAKENTKAAEKLAEIEEANKTELQKALDRAEAAESKVAGYETREQIAAWKTEVAEATGVPAAALAGSTKEELEAHAKTLKPLITTQAAAQRPQPLVIPAESKVPPALNSSALEDALRKAVGIN